MKPLAQNSSRIGLVDALRGFALLGIVLVHTLEHFEICNQVVSDHSFLQAWNQRIYHTVSFLFAGKAYAIFSLLFGFSFYIQFENNRKKGIDFTGRFMWRMCLLFGFGLFHLILYSGDILTVYALIGLLMIPFDKVRSKAVLIVALIAMLEPWELIQAGYALFHPEYAPAPYSWPHYRASVAAATGDSLPELIRTNLTSGLKNGHIYCWRSGRYFQTFSLFLLGMWLGRRQLFIQSAESVRFWKKVLLVSVPAFLLLYGLTENLGSFEWSQGLRYHLGNVFKIWRNLSFMSILVSVFCLSWFLTRLRKIQNGLVPYGRMSLTNYIGSSFIGSVLFYGYGFGLYARLGSLVSLLVALSIFTAQSLFSRWWLSRRRQGPLEHLWYRLTWFK